MLLLCLYVKQSQIKSQVINIFTLILINEQLTLTHTQGLHCKCAQLLNFGSFLMIWWCSKFDDIFTMKKKTSPNNRHGICVCYKLFDSIMFPFLQTGQGGVMWQHTVVFFKGITGKHLQNFKTNKQKSHYWHGFTWRLHRFEVGNVGFDSLIHCAAQW